MRNGLLAGSLAVAVLLVGGCPLDPSPEPGTCTYGGKSYAAGERFPATDGCNTCTCSEEGAVACTEIACRPPGSDAGAGGGCTYGGKTYEVGDAFPSTDGCNSCSCTSEGVACTLKACEPVTPACVRAGCSGQLCVDASKSDVATTCEWREEYACYQKARCERQADGRCGFTPTAELERCLGQAAGCSYGGKTYRRGETFPSTDGCNTCTCTELGVACTKKACPPQGDCRKTGCSGQICADQDVVTTCEFRPEYACYKDAICARQADGRCGFTESEALKKCLADAGLCHQGGRTYRPGESVPSPDGCNSCTCTEGGRIACTARACADR